MTGLRLNRDRFHHEGHEVTRRKATKTENAHIFMSLMFSTRTWDFPPYLSLDCASLGNRAYSKNDPQ